MQSHQNDLEFEDKLLYNSLLSSTIRKNKPTEHKIKKIEKYLDRGADINTTDANNKNNTPLHVAVMKEEPEVVLFLLKRGANVNNKNKDNRTALDVARLSDKSSSHIKEIITILESFNHKKLTQYFSQQDINDTLKRKSHAQKTKIKEISKNSTEVTVLATTHLISAPDCNLNSIVACDIENQSQSNNANSAGSVKNKKKVQNNNSKELKKANDNKTFLYQKRTGTSGLSGQLYETKLLSLILFRALYVQEVKHFLIATNVESMGAFDDIVFRYCINEVEKPRIMFIQAKHRDNPKKDKFTVDEILKLNGDFSLHKYLESYLKISQMFVPENKDDMFKGEFKNMDCEFVIYTTAYENFSKMKPVEPSQGTSFIKTTKDGKVFQFNYDDEDLEFLVQTVAKSRAVLLAKRLSKFIFKDNYSNMMMDDLISTYHVYLAQHILTVEYTDAESQNNFHSAKFRDTFFTSDDNLILAFKATISKEASLVKKNESTEKVDEMDILKSWPIKLPVNFGNLHFCFSGSEKKQKKNFDNICLKFKKLFENADVSTNVLVKVDDNMVGPNEILQSKDSENYSLGGLVGNLLIFDNDTKTLKFNTEINSLSEDNIKILEALKTDVLVGIDLSKCRLDINVHRFPRLSLVHHEYDKNLIKEFLSKLMFYTNQSTEDKVENIVKEEIDKYFTSSIPRQNDALFRAKSDAIFLKVHDSIQKWWKRPIQAEYLRDSCEYFLQAEQDILNSPLLSILNFTYTKTIKNTLPDLKFKDIALELLHLDSFIKGTVRIVSIVTKENALTSIKLIQYFKELNDSDYTFIDLDYIVIKQYFVDVKSEIKESKINTLIVVCKSEDVIADVNQLIKLFKGRIIIISNWDLVHQINGTSPQNIVKRVDSKTGFEHLTDTMRKMLLKERFIVFQGKEVPLGILFEDKSYHLIHSNVLYKIINNEKTTIGNSFNNPSYDEILDHYINEQVCRYVTLDPNVQAVDELNILKYNEIRHDFMPDLRDVILISDKDEEFAEFCNSYKNCNVHRFSGDDCLVWQKSRGNLLNILKHIHRSSHDAYSLQPRTLSDLKEKVVIISAEPGMGKSSLLTHLAMNTKDKYPELWISKINLLDNTNEFLRMRTNKVIIDLKEAVKFLFRVIGFEVCKSLHERKAVLEDIIDQVSIIGEDISFNKNEKELNITGLSLLEIEYFIYCFNNDRVALLFDGFDEICPDFANEFMQLVNILKKSKIIHLWVTSRLYNVLHQLENSLETFSYTIQPLSNDNQMEFLQKIWSRKLKPSILNYFPFNTNWGLKNVIQGFLQVLSAVLCDSENKFISIPLHLYMISEIFKDSFHSFPLNAESIESFICKQNTMNKVNLNQIYERFVDVKFFKIRFGEKKPLLCINDPDMRKLIDNERTAFFYIHKIIAARVIFGKSDDGLDLFNEQDDEIRDFIERIKVGEEKTGIIEQIVRNEPKFVHYTFAEYFATEYLYDRLKSFHYKISWWLYLLDTFLQSDQGGPLRFFNAKLRNHQVMFNEIYNADLNIIFEDLLLEHKKLTTLIFMAIDRFLEDTAILLLKCIKTVLNKKYLNDFINIVSKSSTERCIVCIAVERSAINAVTFIINLIKDIDINRLIDLFNCSDLPKHNPMVKAYGALNVPPNLEMLNVLLSDLPPPTIVDMFCIQLDYKWFNKNMSKKLIHIISSSLGNKNFRCFDKALEKLNKEQLIHIFSVKDSDKKLAAHRAASEQSYTFFEKIESLLDRNQFKEICMTVDRAGLTPIHYFKYTRENCDKLKDLLDKVYEGNTNAKLTLKYFIDENVRK